MSARAGNKRSHDIMLMRDGMPLQSPQLSIRRDDLQPVARSAPAEELLNDGTPKSAPRKVAFDPNASVVLIGLRGAGKSSLGFLAATSYNRRLIEFDRAFLEETKSTITVYRKAHGVGEYHLRQAALLNSLLTANDKHSVIVCSFSNLEGEGSRGLIANYALSHPVVYIARDSQGIRSHLRILSGEKALELVRASKPLLRACSNFEFYNVLEHVRVDTDKAEHSLEPSRPSYGPFLTLKRAERDFIRLLRNISGDVDRGRSHQSAYPLSQVAVEDLEFTSAVAVSAEDVLHGNMDLDEAVIGADVVQLALRLGENGTNDEQETFTIASKSFAVLRRSSILPIWIVVNDYRNAPAKQSHAARLALTEFCFRLGPEYCSVDLSLDRAAVQNLLTNKGRTKVVGDFVFERSERGWKDQQCLEIFAQAQSLGCDLVRLTMANARMTDNFDVQAFRDTVSTHRNQQGTYVIAYCSGIHGRTSAVFNNILTSVATQGRTEQCDARPSPSLTARERTQALFASFFHEALRFFIYGANVDFSLSPAMHNAAYDACGMPHAYRTHSASSLDDLLQLVREEDFGGAAIVQPFKTTTLTLVDMLSPHAQAIGALNTVIPIRGSDIGQATTVDQAAILRGRNRTGPVIALYACNTDWVGIRACIRRGLSPANTVRAQSSGLVCGAGGMARAAVYAMISLGVKNVFICSRTSQHAQAVADHYNHLIQANAIVELNAEHALDTSVNALVSFGDSWPNTARHPTMIVSCIPPLQADGSATDFTLPDEWMGSRTGGVVVELAYKPVVTPLVRQVRKEVDRGWILMDGLDMLPEQAFAQFELFTGRRAPRKLMREQVFKHYREAESDLPSQGALNSDSPTHS